jgi:hypothetical protein
VSVRLPSTDIWASDNPLLADLLGDLSGPISFRGDQAVYRDRTGAEHRRRVPARDLVRGWSGNHSPWITAGLAAVHRGRSFIVEHTSANPVHPLHLAVLRGTLVGNGLVELLRSSGGRVSARYFVNDLGKQVHFAGWGMARLDPRFVPAQLRQDHVVGVVYALANMIHGQRDKDIELLFSRYPWLRQAMPYDPRRDQASVVSALTQADAGQFRPHLEAMVSAAQGDLGSVGATIDSWEFESQLAATTGPDPSMLSRFARLVTVNGVVCVSTPSGLIPVMRPDGRSTYFLRDLHNVLARSEGAHMIHVIGADQHLLQSELIRIAGQVGRTVEYVPVGDVRIGDKRSSARQARLTTMEDVRQRRGTQGLADLCLGVASVRRIRRLRIDPDHTSPWARVVRRAGEALREDVPAGRDRDVDDGRLEMLCVRAPGVFATALKRREIAPVARYLIMLSTLSMRSIELDGGIHPDTVPALRQIYDIAARVCGQNTTERNDL